MTRASGPGRLPWRTGPAAARRGRWSGSSSRPPRLARIQRICCCAATTTWHLGQPWQPSVRWRSTRPARSWNQQQKAVKQARLSCPSLPPRAGERSCPERQRPHRRAAHVMAAARRHRADRADRADRAVHHRPDPGATAVRQPGAPAHRLTPPARSTRLASLAGRACPGRPGCAARHASPAGRTGELTVRYLSRSKIRFGSPGVAHRWPVLGRPARMDAAEEAVLLEDQDRRLRNQQIIAEGDALAAGRSGCGSP